MNLLFSDDSNYNLNWGYLCKSNYKPIVSTWQDCKNAAESLGFTGDTVNHVNYEYPWGSTRPQGCFKGGDNGRFHFNKGSGGDSSIGDQILCMRVQAGTKAWNYLSYITCFLIICFWFLILILTIFMLSKSFSAAKNL